MPGCAGACRDMADILVLIIGLLLIGYLFLTILYPEKF
jgi:K+-transporting ATPase KdpF subunit